MYKMYKIRIKFKIIQSNKMKFEHLQQQRSRYFLNNIHTVGL